MLKKTRTSKSRRLIQYKTIGLIGLTLLVSPIVHAIDLQGYKFTDSYRYSYLDDSSQEQFQKPLIFTTSFAHIKTPLYVTDARFNNFIAEVIRSYDLLTLGASIRLSPNFIFSLETAVIKTKLKNDSETHFGDTHLKGKIRLLSDSEQSLSLLPEIILPTGSQYSYTTRAAVSLAFKLAYEYHKGPFHLLANAGYAHSPDNKYSIINYRNLLLTEFGLSYDLNTTWNINLELNRGFTLSSDYRQDEGDYYLTMKNKTTNDLATYFGAGVAGFSSIDRKNWSVFAGLKFNFGENKSEVQKVESNIPNVLPEIKLTNTTQILETPKTIKSEIKSAADEKRIYGKVFALENIYFDNGKTNIKDGEQLKIDQLVTKIAKHIKSINHIVIEGYASKTGNSKNNQTLSLKRATEVQMALINSGIKEEITSIVAYGDRALKQDRDENKNRKVQFRIYLLKERK